MALFSVLAKSVTNIFALSALLYEATTYISLYTDLRNPTLRQRLRITTVLIYGRHMRDAA